jgi:hypothetical protein
MVMNRRAVLKTLAAVPAVSLLPGLSGCDGGSYVNLLLHGLFMMEFNDNKLIIATPKVDGHIFKMRKHGQARAEAKDLPEFITMLGVVKEGSQDKFKPENLTFPVSDLKRDYAIDYQNPSKHRCTMVLPLPYDILGLRAGKKDDFKPQAGDIGSHIKSTSSTRLATITCLRYKPASGVAPFTINYYAEHPNPPTKDSVNAALKAVKTVCGAQFTLQMDDLAPVAPYDNPLPEGVDRDDENPFQQEHAVDVASCPQFGIRG